MLTVASVKARCKVLFDQAELREMHFKTILRHKDAEIAHLAAKHEVERKRADGEATRCRTLTNQVSTFSHTEAELRSQLNIYVEKFKQVCLSLVTTFMTTKLSCSCSHHSRSKTHSTIVTSYSSPSAKRWKRCPRRPRCLKRRTANLLGSTNKPSLIY